MSEKLTLREKLHIGEKRPDGEKPRMSKKLKKGIIAAACVVGVCGAVWGGLTIARNAQRGDVNVYAVNECAMTDYWGDTANTSGTVNTDKLQKIYISETQEVSAIYVKEGQNVKKGDKLCGTRVIPLVIAKERMEQAKKLAGSEPIIRLVPVRPRKYGLVTTGNEVFYGRIQDTFTPVVEAKLAELGCEMAEHVVLNDDHEKITAAIKKMLNDGCEMVFCSGGMSVDPDDKTPLAIKNTGAKIVSYGAPVLPGAMFLVSYYPDGRPICGLPGCVMYAKRTIFDLVLPYLVTDTPVTANIFPAHANRI